MEKRETLIGRVQHGKVSHERTAFYCNVKYTDHETPPDDDFSSTLHLRLKEGLYALCPRKPTGLFRLTCTAGKSPIDFFGVKDVRTNY